MATNQMTEVSPKERFFRYFQYEITALQEQMSRLAHSAEQLDMIEHLNAAIARLSSELKDASTYLPTYDQRTYAEAVKALREKLEETRTAYAPKARFTFKTARKNPSAISISDAAELAAQKHHTHLVTGHASTGGGILPSSMESSLATTPNYFSTPPNEETPNPPLPPQTEAEQSRPFPSVSQLSGKTDPTELRSNPSTIPRPAAGNNTISISNQSSAHLILPSSRTHASSPCALTDLRGCVIDLSVPSSSGAPFASLTMRNVKGCLLVCGSVSGPAHVTGLEGCVLVVSCRQLRMHGCVDVDVYLRCSGRPIIEGCQGVRFAELPGFYQDMEDANPDSDSTSTHGKPQNMWDQVDDFKWLKAEQSPNWSILPPEDRVVEEAWREIVPGGPGWSLEDILTATKVLTKPNKK